MNTSALKSFAPNVRNQLLEAVERKLDYTLTADTPDLREKGTQIASLRRQAEADRDALIERAAYTWFNRLAALRFLDARHWHPFRSRVLTPATEEETQPELLKQFRNGSLPDEFAPFVDSARLRDLLDGRLPTAIAGADPQGEVYRHLILAACRYYHALMPFMFEEIDDETELLLPDDLLTQASPVEGFRTEILDKDCEEVEVLGWLYQFYISEKKDAVMARKKAVPSEDIPAVTQLFTPHWIVRYLVENSLGRLWLRSRPNSRLKEHMPYYVEDPEGQAPADSLTVATPEEIKLLDPACGSGHMLTYAFDLLVKIYEEEGHAPSEIPEKILTHNLYGLEICPRAAQLASFALVCKAREQSRRAFRSPVQPQVMCLRDVVLTPDEVKGFTDATGTRFSQDELAQIHQFREHTETFGALNQPVLDEEKLAALKVEMGEQAPAGDLLAQNTHRKLRLVLDQAEMLSQRYQVVVANPPYMGTNYMGGALKSFVKETFGFGRGDLYASFIYRNRDLTIPGGRFAMITMQSWMFLSSYTELREAVLAENLIESFLHLGPGAFDTIAGEVVQTCAFTISTSAGPDRLSDFFRLTSVNGERRKLELFLTLCESGKCGNRRHVSQEEFAEIPGSPFAYWSSPAIRNHFKNTPALGKIAEPTHGIATGDNDRFLRLWYECEASQSNFGAANRAEAKSSKARWFPVTKGGSFRRWYGNLEFLIDWEDDGHLLRTEKHSTGRIRATNFNLNKIFRENAAWSTLSTNALAMRYTPPGTLFESKGSACFTKNHRDLMGVLGFGNSNLVNEFLLALSPTLDYHEGPVSRLPYLSKVSDAQLGVIECALGHAKADWDNFETSWDFCDLPLLRPGDWEVEPGQPGGPWKGRTLAESWDHYATYCNAAIRRMQELETENNRLWIDAYGLQDELDPAVPEEEITLARADSKKDMAAFLSYSVGCMMGRYSLDEPGLILADAGDTVENYLTKVGKPLDEIQFPPDEDSIIPVLDGEWFEDDIVARTREFLRVTFGEDTLNENLRFIEDSLGKPLRKYFLTDFYKDHLQRYKKRPIYWLFQSPKKGFNALIYLHRYTPDSLNLLLNDYLRDYLKKIETRLQHLDHTQATSTVTREKTAARKEADKLRKTQKECQDWERDTLLPLAQQRITIDLDDGVKSNYPKFTGAVAKVAGL